MSATTTITITEEARDLIFNHGTPSPQLAQRMRFGVASGRHLRYDLSDELLDELMALVLTGGVSAKMRSIRRKFQRLEEMLRQAGGLASEAREDAAPRASPRDVREEIEDTLRAEDFRNLDEANEAIQQITSRHNTAPHREFQGLSPEQVTRLIYIEWNAPDSPIRINQHLKPAQLEDVVFLQNARTFLDALAQAPAKATQAGNLNRKFVAQLLEEMAWPPGFLEELHRYNKAVNEEDAWAIHILRIVLSQAGLMRKYKGAFRITKRGNEERRQEMAGSLFFSLFMAYFRKFNLAYLDRCPSCPGVQHTLGYSLCILERNAKKWTTPAKLATRIYLPIVLNDIPESVYNDQGLLIMKSRIVSPLETFGLLECQRDDDPYYKEIQRVRVTPLFHVFLTISI